MATPLSEERDLTNIDRLRIGALHVEPPFADEDLLDEITALESELERLRARNAELVEVLRSVEWFGDTGDDRWYSCPSCGQHQPYHALDCALDAALREVSDDR